VSVFDIDYTYDSMGNRTQQVEDTITTNYTYSNMMRLLSKTELLDCSCFLRPLYGSYSVSNVTSKY